MLQFAKGALTMSSCIFYDARKEGNLADDRVLCDALRLQIDYLCQKRHVDDFIVLDSSDSDIVFSALVDEYKNQATRSREIACTLYFEELCGRRKRYRTNFNCLARYKNGAALAHCLVRKTMRLLLIDDGSKTKPYLYELADSEKIPIHIIDPAQRSYRTKHEKDCTAFISRALRSTVPHSLKKRLDVLQRGRDEACEQIHNWGMTALLEEHKKGGGAGFLRETHQRLAAMLDQEIRVVSALLEYRDKRLSALYWKAKDADDKASDCSSAEDWAAFKNPCRGLFPSPRFLASTEKADDIAWRFRKAFNKKSAELGGFTIKGKLFLGR